MLKKIAIVALFGVVVSPAFAGDATSFYAGVDAGSSKIDGISGRKSNFGGFVAYQFNNNLAVEAGYHRLGTLTISNVDVDLKQTALSLVGSTPIGNDFELMGRIGYNKVSASASLNGGSGSASDSGALFGVGIGYNFNKSVSARLEFQRPSSDATSVNLGVSFKF